MIVKHSSIILLLNCIPFVVLLRYEKPVAEKLWRQRCVRNSLVLNDCNWCYCGSNFRYTCDARVCGEVDMFGHFKDAIRDINVGMEGHGVWRSTEPACEPGVHYHRGDLLCVCTEDGTWPNPVCRDTFRVLHSVETVENFKVSESQKCSPTKLYLADCNVCFCPSTGYIDPSMCSQTKCSRQDHVPVKATQESDEVYAQCKVDKSYKIGCKSCICLRNNRLLCNNCTKDSHCEGRKIGENFIVDCNTCHCDAKGLMYCTVNRCLHSEEEIQVLNKYRAVRSSAEDCEPGTRFRKECNTCYCFQIRRGVKSFACTVKSCSENSSEGEGCVIGDRYEKGCLNCHCSMLHGEKMEFCEDSGCSMRDVQKNRYKPMSRIFSQDCEPMQVYEDKCNSCQCLPDGKTLTCTDEPCDDMPISLDIIPVAQELPSCPEGHSYKIDCNVCFCLANGNALCTTMQCKNNL